MGNGDSKEWAFFFNSPYFLRKRIYELEDRIAALERRLNELPRPPAAIPKVKRNSEKTVIPSAAGAGKLRCPLCNTEQPAGIRSCKECGARFQYADKVVIPKIENGACTCPNCGQVQRANRSVCFECGIPFATEE
ncbi:MAG: hypothetical protein FWF10_00355 [Clostridiales bacterium]|nr:hypothetical protein [Clostridiales bacterium]